MRHLLADWKRAPAAFPPAPGDRTAIYVDLLRADVALVLELSLPPGRKRSFDPHHRHIGIDSQRCHRNRGGRTTEQELALS
jgi:hypothetical protein